MVSALLARDDVGLITATGRGGVGTTPLALHPITAIHHHDNDVALIDLAVIASPSQVLPTVAGQGRAHGGWRNVVTGEPSRGPRSGRSSTGVASA